ncbi:MAG: hypothetical protein HFI37_06650 [Lachnospiraceae bacterium]|nr:hypothetical protein [Lachnospiraceae bacterium]
MTFDTFKTTILESLSTYYGDDYTLSIRNIPKNNQILLDGLTIQEKNCNISPAIYLNPYYIKFQNGTSLFTILEEIKNTYAISRPTENIDLNFFSDFHQVKQRICMKLVHYEKNTELLKELPHVRFLDLAVVFYYLISILPCENASILIYNSHMEHWNASPEELLSLAKENTPKLLPYYFDDVFSILTDVDDLIKYAERSIPPLYVLTNSEKLFGASTLLYPNLLLDIANRMKCNFVIFPSSIHELLLLPVFKKSNFQDYQNIITEINQSHLALDEILSDHAYYYDRTKESII